MLNPSVPLDFLTVEAAFNAATESVEHARQTLCDSTSRGALPSSSANLKAIRILVGPGRHRIANTITIQKGYCVTLQGIEEASTSIPAPSLLPQHPRLRPTLLMLADERNIPMIRLQEGNLVLHNLRLWHKCWGVDVWNGNAALHIQPQEKQALAQAALSHCEITSRTGRGVAAHNAARLDLSACRVTQCAATGVYVGGHGQTEATFDHCELESNGQGSELGGIFRRHSGILLAQGKMQLSHCKLSRNSGSGLNIWSTDQAQVTVCNSSFDENEHRSMELPDDDSDPDRIVLDEASRRSANVNDALYAEKVATEAAAMELYSFYY